MPNIFLVMIGGAVGAGLRFEVGRLAHARIGPDFPLGTLIVNLLGGFLAGLLVASLARVEGSEQLRLLLGVGLLGGFTTFSAFSVEVVQMMERGQSATAAAYAMLSVAGSVAAAFLGLLAARVAA